MLSDRELDALVAEHVFGLQVLGMAYCAHDSVWCDPFNGVEEKWPVFLRDSTDDYYREDVVRARLAVELPKMIEKYGPEIEATMRASARCLFGWHPHALEAVRPYATDGGPMLSVIEAMREHHWLVSVTLKLCGKRVEDEAIQFFAEFRQTVPPFSESVWALDPSAPRAVAIAALRALGVTVDA